MRRPVVTWACGVCLGIVLADLVGAWAILMTGALLLLRIFLRRDWLVPFVSAAIVGTLLLIWHSPVWPGPYGSYQLRGRVASVEQQTAIVQVNEWAGRKVPWWDPVRVRVAFEEGRIKPGDRVLTELSCQPLPEASNPGEFAYGRYLRRQGILATAKTQQLKTEASATASMSIRQQLVERALALGDKAGELLATLLLGNKPGDWADAWRRIGTSHILAVSGLHVGLLLLLFERLLALCRVPRKPRLVVAGIMLLSYGMLVGPRASVWRAIIMALIGIVAVLTGRLKDWPTAIAVAALLLLLVNPHLLFDPGFQLSFAATISLFTLAPKVKAILPVLPWQLDSAVSASVAAQLATLPLVISYFYLLSPFSLLANLLLLPLLPLVMVSGVAWLLFPAGFIVRPIVSFVFSGLLRLVDWLASWPLAAFSPGVPPVWLSVFYAVLLVMLLLRLRPKLQRPLLLAWGLSLLLLVSWQPLLRTLTNQHQLAVLSVGQGSCSALHTAGLNSVLFDVGGADESVGEWTIVPYLRWRGTWQISAIYLSHLHEDHTLGLEAVLRDFRVKQVVVSPSAIASPAYPSLLDLGQKYGVAVNLMYAGEQHRYGLLTVSSIFQGADLAISGENESSLVLQLNYPAFSMLLPGDIGAAEEQSVLPYVHTPLDVLLVPHHGSANSSSQQFLGSLRPDHSIISTGPNRYGHPAPVVLRRLEQLAGSTWRTDQNGAVLITTDGLGYRIQPWREGVTSRP